MRFDGFSFSFEPGGRPVRCLRFLLNRVMKTEPIELLEFPQVRVCLWARTPWERARGLLGRDGLLPDTCMGFARCRALHTIGMRFPLDILFTDRSGNPVKVLHRVPPGRLLIWGGWRARTAYELASPR